MIYRPSTITRPLITMALAASSWLVSVAPARADEVDPPEVSLGHRLFLETRFAQFFAMHAPANVNALLTAGDPAVDVSVMVRRTIPSPYAGSSINCGSCHLVDEQKGIPEAGMRSYTDFARRSPLPRRDDGRTETTRNSPTMVNAFIDHPGATFLHFDGQFNTVEDLIRATLLGRNFGWMPDESAQALANIGRILREDDGSNALAHQYFGSYRQVFLATDPAIPAQFVLPAQYRADIAQASDQQILDSVVKLIAAYSKSLVYKKDDQGNYQGSPYDLFLAKNKLPRRPAAGEANLAYARRLRAAVKALTTPVFVSEADGHFIYQRPQPYVFEQKELAGLQTFLSEPSAPTGQGVRGNCLSCHTPPDFTDFKFHNTGATQEEYDGIHGSGAFARLAVPSLAERRKDADLNLPLSPAHPRAVGIFFSAPDQNDPRRVDLGLWNVFANPDLAPANNALQEALCADAKKLQPRASCSADDLLRKTIAVVKTPSVRDLGQSEPYLHTGQKDRIEDVLRFYISTSALQRAGLLRNGDADIGNIFIRREDVDALGAFIRSLNEDYH